MRLGDFSHFYLELLAHTHYGFYFRLSHWKQARGFDVFDRIYLDRHTLELLFSLCLFILLLLDFECVCEERLSGVARRMGDLEYLFGTLSKLIYLAFYSHLLDRIFYVFDVDHSLISERMEEVKSFNRLLPSLLVAKYQINPLMKIVGYKLRLKCSSVHVKIGIWISIGPERYPHIANFLFVLPHSQVQVLIVLQKRAVLLIKLRNQFFKRSRILHDIVPVIFDTFEQSVRFIEPTTLKFKHIFRSFTD